MALSGLAGNRQRAAGRYRPMSEINVTPLVDVMLVLLVVFMVAAPLLTVGVPVDLPQTQAPPITEPKEPLVITINDQSRIFIQETEVATDALVPRLTGDHQQQPRRARLCPGRQGDQLRPRARSDEPGQLRRVPQGLADRRVAERGSGEGGRDGRRRTRPLGAGGQALRAALGRAAMSVAAAESRLPPEPGRRRGGAEGVAPSGLALSAALHLFIVLALVLGLPTLVLAEAAGRNADCGADW